MWDVIVIGAGPAGLMAAGTAASAGARTLLLEKMEKPGRKLRITGKGRCNITNTRPWAEFAEHVRCNAEFLSMAFAAFDNRRTADFFRAAGLELSVERGERIFPASGRAQDVADTLERWCRTQGCEIRCGVRVSEIVARDGEMAGVRTAGGELLETPCVVLCTGGISYPATGSTGDGYRMASVAGHRIEPLRPSLVALYGPPRVMNALQGVSLRNVGVSLQVDSRVAVSRFGEVEFLAGRTGSQSEIGGAAVLQLSRDAVDALTDGHEVWLCIDFKPALTGEQITARIVREIQALRGTSPLRDLLRKLLPGRVDAVVARELSIPLNTPLNALGKGDTARLAAILKDFRLPVEDHAPAAEAIITAGGVDTAQVNAASLESKKLPGLYFAGELLDLDADTGGYNLQIAFSTGRQAGRSAAEKALKR